MYNITLNKEQLEIINIALASYVRVDCGQFKYGLERWEYELDRSKLNSKQQMFLKEVDEDGSLNKMWGKSKQGIEAYSMHQVLRHQLWKEDPERSNMTVDSSVTIMDEADKITIEKQ